MFRRTLSVLLWSFAAVSAGQDHTGFDTNLQLADTLNNRALAFKQSGRLDSSLYYLHLASSILPLPEILTNIGNIESTLGRNESARAYYNKALQADRENSFAWYNLASLHWEGGDPEQALLFFSNALRGERAHEVRSQLPSQVVFAQNLPRIRESALVAQTENLNLGLLLRIVPSPLPTDRAFALPGHKEDRQTAVFTTPSNDTGNVLYSLGRYDEALFYYLQAQDEAPRCINAQINAGLCHFKAGRFEECREALENALFWQEILSTKPMPSSSAAIMRSRFCSESQRRTCFADGPSPQSSMTGDLSMAHYILAMALHNTGNAERAQAELRKALAIDPEFSPALTELARTLRRNGDFALAVDVLVRSSQASGKPARPDLGFGGYCRIDSDLPSGDESAALKTMLPDSPQKQVCSKHEVRASPFR